MKNVFFKMAGLAFLFLLLHSCGNKKTGSSTAVAADTTKFFPVENYFSEQVKIAVSNGTTMYKLSDINGKKDSVPISKEQFTELAIPFTSISISDSINKKQFTESSFLDLATNSITFSYSGRDANMPVKNITILTDTATLQVKRVFINKTLNAGDSTVDEKSGWKNNTSFFINRIVSLPGKPVRTELITVAWNIQQ